MTLRLHAHSPEFITEEGRNSPFVTPTRINEWESYIGQILPEWPSANRERANSIRNIGHYLQLLEFSAALLLEDYERRNQRRLNSSLHETVKNMMILKFCIFSSSVVEGIGSYLHRYKQRNNATIDWNRIISSDKCKNAVKKEIFPSNANLQERNSLSTQLQNMIDLRNRVHLDTVAREINYHSFEYTNAFIPTHQTLRSVLMGLNSQRIIRNSPLFDVI